MTQTPGSLGPTLADDLYDIELLPNPWRYRVSPLPGKGKLRESFYVPMNKVDFHQGEQPDLPGFGLPVAHTSGYVAFSDPEAQSLVDGLLAKARKKPGPKPKAQAE